MMKAPQDIVIKPIITEKALIALNRTNTLSRLIRRLIN